MKRRVALVCFTVMLAATAVLLLSDAPDPATSLATQRSRDADHRVADEEDSDPEPVVHPVPEDGSLLATRHEVLPTQWTVSIVHRNEPVSGAEIRLLPWTDELAEQASEAHGLPPEVTRTARMLTTNADGTAIVPLAPPLLIAARGDRGAPGAWLVTSAGDNRLELQDGYSLPVRVEGLDGVALSGITVEARAAFESDRRQWGHTLTSRRLAGFFFSSRGMTDSAGRFVASGLSPGRIRLGLSASGRSSLVEENLWMPESADVEQVFRLGTGASVTGVVVALETGAPLPDVEVEAAHRLRPFDAELHGSTRTDDAGRFRIDGVLAESPATVLAASKHHYATEFVDIPDLKTGEAREVHIALSSAVLVSGVVRSVTGEPIEGVLVYALDDRTTDAAGFAPTDEHGRFTCDFLQAGTTYRIQALATNYEEESTLITPPCEPLELTMHPYGVMQGRVLVDGAPVRSGHVRLLVADDSGSVWTQRERVVDDEGRFSFDWLGRSETSYELLAMADGFAPTSLRPVRLRPPETDDHSFDVELRRGAAVFGRVIDGASEAPIDIAKITLVELRGGSPVDLPRDTSSDASGAYRLEGLPTGREFGLRVEHTRYATTLVKLRIESAGSTFRQDVRLAGPAALTVRLRGPDGALLPRFRVTCRSPGKPEQDASTTDGIVRCDGLEPGDWRVQVTSAEVAGGALWAIRELTLESGDDRDVEVSFVGGGTLVGLIDGPPGPSGRRRWKVYARHRNDPSSWFYCDAGQGYPFEIPGMPAGPYEIETRTGSEGPSLSAVREVEIVDGKRTELRIEVGRGSLKGTVRTGDGAPVAGAKVDLLEHPADRAGDHAAIVRHEAVSSTEGWFTVLGLREERLTWRVRADGYALAIGEVRRAAEASETEIGIEMAPEAVLFVVPTSTGGSAPEGVRVEAISVGGTSRESFRSDGRDPEGRHRISYLPAGRYQVTASADPWFPGIATIAVASGDAVEVPLTLRRRGQLQIRLRDAQGMPTASEFGLIDRATSAPVIEYVADGWVHASVEAPGALVTSDDGELTLIGLPVGKYELRAMGQVRAIEVTVDEPLQVTIQAIP